MHARITEYPAPPPRRRTLALIGTNFVLFAALVGYTIYVRTTTKDWPVAPPFEFGNLLMVFAMAMAAVCGSITMVVGGPSSAKGNTEEAVRWIAIAISSWLVFLFLECVEWANLIYLKDLGPKTPFSSTFLLLTGTHWLAVIA